MTPKELTEFFFETGVAPWRSSGGVSQNPNYKPFSIEASGQLAAFSLLFQEQQNIIATMYEVSGLNAATATSPDPKQNEMGLNLATQATNNALFLISDADKSLVYELADAVIQKLQIAVKLGKVEGYANALGSDTVRFFQINPDISLHEFGIFLRDAMTADEKQQLYQEISAKEQQGLLDISDRFFIMRLRNSIQQWAYLSYKVNLNKQREQQAQQQNIQLQAQQNAQNAQMAAQQQAQLAQMQHAMKMDEINAQGQWAFVTAQLKTEGAKDATAITADARKVASQIQANAHVAASQPKTIAI